SWARQVGAFSAAQEAEAVLQDFEDAITVNIRAVFGGFFQDGEDDVLLAGTGEVFEAHLLCDGEEFPNRLLFEFRKVHWLIGVCPEIDIQDAPGGTASCWFSMRKQGSARCRIKGSAYATGNLAVWKGADKPCAADAVTGLSTGSQGAVEERGQLRLGQGAHLGGFHGTVLEHGQRRDATHAILARGFRVLVDIDLGNLELAG